MRTLDWLVVLLALNVVIASVGVAYLILKHRLRQQGEIFAHCAHVLDARMRRYIAALLVLDPPNHVLMSHQQRIEWVERVVKEATTPGGAGDEMVEGVIGRKAAELFDEMEADYARQE